MAADASVLSTDTMRAIVAAIDAERCAEKLGNKPVSTEDLRSVCQFLISSYPQKSHQQLRSLPLDFRALEDASNRCASLLALVLSLVLYPPPGGSWCPSACLEACLRSAHDGVRCLNTVRIATLVGPGQKRRAQATALLNSKQKHRVFALDTLNKKRSQLSGLSSVSTVLSRELKSGLTNASLSGHNPVALEAALALPAMVGDCASASPGMIRTRVASLTSGGGVQPEGVMEPVPNNAAAAAERMSAHPSSAATVPSGSQMINHLHTMTNSPAQPSTGRCVSGLPPSTQGGTLSSTPPPPLTASKTATASGAACAGGRAVSPAAKSRAALVPSGTPGKSPSTSAAGPSSRQSMVVVHGGGGGGCMPINATSPLLQNLLKRRPMLVLDMDETLIHTPRTMLAGGGAAIGKTIPRPGLHMFLQAVVDIYEIVIFTAATKPYADPILDRIEKDGGVKYFPRRLYREHCSIRGSMMTKDMRRIPGCDVKRAIIIDNLRQNFMLQPRNGICCKDFVGNPADTALFMLAPMLKAFPPEEEAGVAAAAAASGNGGALVDAASFLSRWLPTVLQACNPSGTPVPRSKVQAAQVDRLQSMAPAGSGPPLSFSPQFGTLRPPPSLVGSYAAKPQVLQHQQQAHLRRWAPKSFHSRDGFARTLSRQSQQVSKQVKAS